MISLAMKHPWHMHGPYCYTMRLSGTLLSKMLKIVTCGGRLRVAVRCLVCLALGTIIDARQRFTKPSCRANSSLAHHLPSPSTSRLNHILACSDFCRKNMTSSLPLKGVRLNSPLASIRLHCPGSAQEHTAMVAIHVYRIVLSWLHISR